MTGQENCEVSLKPGVGPSSRSAQEIMSVSGEVSAHVTGGHFASSSENGRLAKPQSSGIHFLRYPVAVAVQVPMILPVLSFSDPVAEIATFPGQTLLMPADEPPIPEN